MPSVSPHAAPAAACRCLQAVEPGSRASALSGREPACRWSCHRHQAPPCCAGLASAPSSDCYARQSLPSTAHQPPGVRGRLSPHRFRSLGRRRSGFTRRPGSQVQHDLIVLPHRRSEIAALLASSTVQAFDRLLRLLCPLLTSPPRSRALRPAQSGSRTRRRSPEVRSTAFAARPPDLPPRSLMAVDFAITCSLVRPGRPRYPVLVHRAAVLLHASFRPRLATTPLRFANPSPPSGWIKDFHLQAVDHARHTRNTAGAPGRRRSPPPVTSTQELALSTVTARRFCDQHEMSLHTATGRSLPYEIVRMRCASTPREAR